MSMMASQSEPPEPAAASSPPKKAITIGDTEYSIDISQIPYLSSFAAFEAKARPDATTLVHGPIPLFSEALKGIELGYRYCFRSIPADLSQYHILCETYDFLGINVVGDQSLNDIFADLKACRTEYELEYKNYTVVKGNKTKARDAAFKLLYLLLLGEFQDEWKDASKVFNVVLFVVSHSATFKWRARTVVRMAYEERFVLTEKQRAGLNNWVNKDDEDLVDEDVTTEEESPYDSDNDYYYNSD